MKPQFDLSLYLVLDPDLCGGAQGMIDTARAAAANGATMVQLRAPNWKKRQWLETATVLKAVLAPLGVPLIINDQIDVALAMQADGVHIGQADLPPDAARRLLGAGRIIGLSASNAAQLADAPLGLIDYLGVGPVHPTGTKADASPVIGLDLFGDLMAAKPLPVVAIGGIKAGNAAPVIAAGADGVAVVSAICGQPDIPTATRALRREIDGARA
ncbi:thiamine-phosphate synthase [Chitiniphilus shinanonensis]|uniref:Thiamine-phosphate synthase n=1 Tax=Chitiniphilus shinanonensis TaxID=553088 RepID=A0ABQ6BZX1_9NEIS|nr:thiamine phosphate synthase [Chitiniphilus shinanonensis]GLS05463.1 thiamine-phosphate synthase [Chitiniphilus shinanonensis]